MTKAFHHNIMCWTCVFPHTGSRANMLTRALKIRSRAPESFPGHKQKQTMRADKPCRTKASEFQTESYSASYGQTTFWRVSVNILVYLRRGILFSSKCILFSNREVLRSRWDILRSSRTVIHSRSGILQSRRNMLFAKQITSHSSKQRAHIVFKGPMLLSSRGHHV